jgi:hypothetical protein
MMHGIDQRGRSRRRTDAPGAGSTIARGLAAMAVVIVFIVLGVEADNGVPARAT